MPETLLLNGPVFGDGVIDLRRKRGPISHQIAPTLEQVCPPVRGLGLILGCVGECSFRNLSWVTG